MLLTEIVMALEQVLQCNCDFDNWEPENSTGHSYVCRIHKAAMEFTGTSIDHKQKIKDLFNLLTPMEQVIVIANLEESIRKLEHE